MSVSHHLEQTHFCIKLIKFEELQYCHTRTSKGSVLQPSQRGKQPKLSARKNRLGNRSGNLELNTSIRFGDIAHSLRAARGVARASECSLDRAESRRRSTLAKYFGDFGKKVYPVTRAEPLFAGYVKGLYEIKVSQRNFSARRSIFVKSLFYRSSVCNDSSLFSFISNNYLLIKLKVRCIDYYMPSKFAL